MTLFEYLAVAFSLVLSTAAMRLVGGIPHAIDARRRYGVHLVFVILLLAATIGGFWAFWSFRELEWNLGRFALALAVPSVVYYNACVLVPENPEAVGSWRDYYYATRRRFFGGFTAWGLLTCVGTTLLLHMPWTHPARANQFVAIALGIVGAVSASPRIHAGLAIAAAVLGALGLYAASSASPLVP